MDNVTLVIVFTTFCLTLVVVVIFARPKTAVIVVKTMCNVIVKLFKHYLP